MASPRWEPKANAVAQVDKLTIGGTWADAAETITLTINTKTLVITIGSLITTTQVATTVKQAFEGETFDDTTASVVPSGGGPAITEFAEITATSAVAVVTLTHDTAGTPFTLTESETSTLGSVTPTTSTLPTGPNHWDDVNNWDTGALPVNDVDEAFIDNSDVDILYGLDQSLIDLVSLTIAASYTGRIGLPKTNEAGYDEYRPDYLQIGAAVCTIGNGEGSGSGRIKIDCGADNMKLTVRSTGAAEEFGVESVLWKGSSTNEIDVQSGSVGCASFGGETAAIEVLRVTSGKVKLGACTLTTLVSQGGDVTISPTATTTTITIEAGTVTMLGTSAYTTININGGTCDYRSSGTITTLNLGGTLRHATFDCAQDMRARIITTLNHKLNATLRDPVNTLTLTNGVAIDSNVSSWSTE